MVERAPKRVPHPGDARLGAPTTGSSNERQRFPGALAGSALEGFTVSHRAVLESLATHGAQTVPALARARPVARQHIQVLVNDLAEWGLVETRSNPAHKRSPLVALTPLGAKRFDAIRRAESRMLESLRLSMPATKLAQLADGLDVLSGDLAQWLAEHQRRE